MLSNNYFDGRLTGQVQIVEFIPNCMYCYLPSSDKDRGYVQIFDYVPEFLKSFKFLVEIEQKVNII